MTPLSTLLFIASVLSFSAASVLAAPSEISTSAVGALKITKLGERCYYVELDWRKRLNWTSAQQFCRSHNMQLASFETEEEMNLFVDDIKDKIPGGQLLTIWLGGNDLEKEGIWQWTNGQPLSFTDFEQGYPRNQRDDEDCLEMRVSKNGGHLWRDLPCLYEYRFLCEMEDSCS